MPIGSTSPARAKTRATPPWSASIRSRRGRRRTFRCKPATRSSCTNGYFEPLRRIAELDGSAEPGRSRPREGTADTVHALARERKTRAARGAQTQRRLRAPRRRRQPFGGQRAHVDPELPRAGAPRVDQARQSERLEREREVRREAQRRRERRVRLRTAPQRPQRLDAPETSTELCSGEQWAELETQRRARRGRH